MIEALAADTHIVNLATTGGNNEVLEIQSAVLKHNGIAPRCVIAGVSTWTMHRDGSPSITAQEYLGLLEWNNVLGLTSRPLLSREGPRIATNLVLPLRSQARQLNRVARSFIRTARARTIGPLPVGGFETYPDELKPADEFLYQDSAAHLMKDWDRLVQQSRPYYPASRYGGRLQEMSLRTTLDRLLSISPDVVLVITPQTPILEPASRSGAPHFWRVLNSYNGRITVIDCSGFRDLSLFIDEGHLNSRGRLLMSAEFGHMLRSLLRGETPASAQHCSVVGKTNM